MKNILKNKLKRKRKRDNILLMTKYKYPLGT